MTRSVDPLLAEARFAESPGAADADQQLAEDRRHATLALVEAAVAAFEHAVEAGIVAEARARHAEIAALRKTHGTAFTRALQRRTAEAERRYSELSRWQHWGDNQRRRQLCEAIEQLAGTGLHPDAIATRVREAQAEWSRLDAIEGHAEQAGAIHGWARRFHAACRRALDPARSYFKKRQALRKTHAQEIAAALTEARAIPADSTDWPLITRTRHAIVNALRALDGVDPHERKALARNLKSTLTALDERLATRYADIEQAKSALIAEAEALAADAHARGAASAARALQQRWRDAGNGRRDRDQLQWKTFRAALDAVFGRLDAERSQRADRDVAARSRADALCGEIEQLAGADDAPPRAAISRLEAEWDALRVRDEALQRRFRAAQSALRDAGLHRERATRRGPYDAWLARYALCRAAESSDQSSEDLRAAWAASAVPDIAAAALAARFEAALSRRDASAIESSASESPGESADDDAMRETLIGIEILAGVESPREDQERRRALQVERLSARMRGTAARTPHQELADLLARWTSLAPVPEHIDARLRRDLAAAIETLP